MIIINQNPALNVEQASQTIAEVSENVAQSSHAATLIARDTEEVNQIAQTILKAGNTLRGNADALNNLAERLRAMTGVF